MSVVQGSRIRRAVESCSPGQGMSAAFVRELHIHSRRSSMHGSAIGDEVDVSGHVSRARPVVCDRAWGCTPHKPISHVEVLCRDNPCSDETPVFAVPKIVAWRVFSVEMLESNATFHALDSLPSGVASCRSLTQPSLPSANISAVAGIWSPPSRSSVRTMTLSGIAS